jgi:hypothetical protein
VGGKGKHNHKNNGGKSSILKVQGVPSCNFCGKTGHTESTCRIKAKAIGSAKKDAKDRNAKWKKEKAEKAQSFAVSASDTLRRKEVLRIKMKMNLIRRPL